MRKPTQAFKSVKDPGNIFDWIPKWARTLPSLIHFSWDIYRDPPPSKKNISMLIYDTLLWAWVQKPTQALKSVKGQGNTFDWNLKWSRTLPSLIYFSWDIYRDPTFIFFFSNIDIWYLTPSCGLEVQKPTQALKSVKGPGNTFDINQKWSRTLPSLIYFSWDMHKVPPNPNIKAVI